MKRLTPAAILLLLMALPGPTGAATDAEGLTLARQDDALIFRVGRADAASVRVRVFDHEEDALLFDSGWRAGKEAVWRPSVKIDRTWRYRIEARDARGALVASHTGIRQKSPLTAIPAETSHGPSVLGLGSSQSTGSLRTFLEGSTAAVTQLGSSSRGGTFRLLDEEGFTTARFEPDADDTGIFFSLYRGQSAIGLSFDGNKNGSGEPLLALTGSAQSASFDMSQLGNDAVELPESSVSSSEMLNEPGAAASNDTGVLTSGSVLLTRTIEAPVGGHVLAVGTVQADIVHNSGTDTAFEVGIALNNTALPVEQNFDTEISADHSDAFFRRVVTVHGLFDVGPGPNTFRLLLEPGLGGGVTVAERQLSLVYLPTSYGLISPISSSSVAVAEGAEATLTDPTSEGSETADRAGAATLTERRLRSELRAMEERLRRLEELLAGQELPQP